MSDAYLTEDDDVAVTLKGFDFNHVSSEFFPNNMYAQVYTRRKGTHGYAEKRPQKYYRTRTIFTHRDPLTGCEFESMDSWLNGERAVKERLVGEEAVSTVRYPFYVTATKTCFSEPGKGEYVEVVDEAGSVSHDVEFVGDTDGSDWLHKHLALKIEV